MPKAPPQLAKEIDDSRALGQLMHGQGTHRRRIQAGEDEGQAHAPDQGPKADGEKGRLKIDLSRQRRGNAKDHGAKKDQGARRHLIR